MYLYWPFLEMLVNPAYCNENTQGLSYVGQNDIVKVETKAEVEESFRNGIERY